MDIDGRRRSLSRREFARSLIGIAAGIGGLPTTARAVRPDLTGVLSIAICHSEDTTSFIRGARLGVSEARRSAELFAGRIDVHERKLGAVSGTALVESVVRDHAMLIIACGTARQVTELSRACLPHGVALFNCCATSDALRRELCGNATFHIEASDAMYQDARRISPGAKSIALWDATLEKYGAAQLNDRFRAFAGQPMDGAAWAGWIAVKIAWESVLRSPGSWIESLVRERTQFDGHKGAPISFRPWDHQLRQPLYAIGKRVTDVPDVGRSAQPARELLDTIGDGPGVQSCRPLTSQ